MKNSLIFIDTNILLDFYRIRSGGIGLPLLTHIDNNYNRLITGNQVEMEYKKNRQRVILESLDRLKIPEWGSLEPPAFLMESRYKGAIEKRKKEIKQQHEAVKKKIEKVLKSPTMYDPIYRKLQKYFKNDSSFNLSRKNKQRLLIRKLARKRFILGYPPRKKDDTSIGDAINWEWIIKCAQDSGKNIIIVSRDSDYGVTCSGTSILNDWLLQEFRERVSSRRKIILTVKLAHAFKMASIAVSKSEEKQEQNLLEEKKKLDLFAEFKTKEMTQILNDLTEKWHIVYKDYQKKIPNKRSES